MTGTLYFILKSWSCSLEEECRDKEFVMLDIKCEVSTGSDDLGCHVICRWGSTVFYQVKRQHSHLRSDFRALHYCAWLANQLAWPQPHKESRVYCQEEDERHQIQEYRSELKATIKATKASRTSQQYHKLTVPMLHCTDAVIRPKRGQNKCWVDKCTYFSECWHFCVINPLF